MSDTNIVKNWSYPFKTAGESSKEVTDPQVYFDALAEAENGFYPMGKNGLWHGGVHFDDNTAALLDQSSIRCIADGEVIAYRIDQTYPETQYGATYTPGAGPGAVTAKYSTGFVLVKHLLELPPAPPPPPPSTSEATTTPPTGAAPAETSAVTAPAPTSSEPTATPERLTFYSLYMHLLDWTSYEANPALQRPAFWGAGLCKVKSDAPDKVRGLNVREHHKPDNSDQHYEANYAKYENKLATLPRGTRIETGEAAPSPNHNWRRLIKATPAVEGLAENTGWVYVLEAQELAENQYLVSEDKSKDVPAIEQIGLHVRESGSGSSSVLAVLPRGTEIQVSGEGNYVKLESIINGNAIPPLTVGADGKLPGYVWLQSLEAQRSPNDLAKDMVYPLPAAQRIKAGELIGHMGLYQEYDQSAPKTRLHLEVFSCEDVPAFIEKSRARAESLPNDQKTLIMVDVGSIIYQPTPADTQIAAGHDVRPATDSPTEGRWVKVHPYVVLKAKKAGFGSFDGAHNRYPMDSDKKTELATEFDLEISELPDTADFLLESYKEDGSNMYAGKANIPSTHVRRKVGIKLNTPVWVKRNALNAQARRSSTGSTLDAWKNFPLSQATDNGQTCGFERILSKASWNDLSADHKAIDADTQKSRWWYVTVANAAGQDISGWVPEADLIVTQCSPWDWPGFSYIEDSTTLVSQQAQTLNAQGVLSPEEARTYAAKIEEAEHGPIFQRLFEIIDQPNNEGIRDKELTPLEIKSALGKPWLAQQLSLLITHYGSEWFSNPAKWNELDALMAPTPGQPNLNWEKEKQRIAKLSWWAALVDKYGINVDGKIWHFQPVGLIGNLLTQKTFKITIEMLKKVFTLGSVDKLQLLANELNQNLAEYKLDTPARLSHFFAQVRVEVGDDYALVESLKYRPEKLSDFSYFSSRPDEAQLYGYIPGVHPANEVEIANRAYNGVTGNSDLGNGDIESGDGWKFRGRGLKQLTGRYNYTDFNQKYPSLWPGENINFIDSPEKLEEPKYAARSAVYFWLKNSLYEIADRGVEPSNVNSITAIINQYTSSYAERRNQFKRIWEIEKIFR